MAWPTHYKFTVRGFFDGSPESWNFGFHMTRTAEGAADGGLDDIDETSVTAAMTAFLGSTVFSNKISVEDWRAYVIGTNGRMQGNGPLLHTFAPAELKGTSTGNRYPPQCSVVVSLLGTDRGPAKYGRMYLPGVVAGIDTDWRLSDANASVIRAATTTFLKDVSDSIDLATLVQSAGCNVSAGPPGSANGTLQIIDHIEVGRVIDTVRNRRKSMLEEYNVGGHIDW